jgi:hypothetical protein
MLESLHAKKKCQNKADNWKNTEGTTTVRIDREKINGRGNQ